jgi:hypothetical protein
MLASVKVPVLFAHHFHQWDEELGMELGALSDFQADRGQQLVTGAGQDFTYRSFADMPHAMHRHQPELFARTVTEWAATLPDSAG